MTRPPITPGSWDTTINNDREPCVILRGESETIAVCCELLEDEAEANARAIAALPDLLAALESLHAIGSEGVMSRSETGKPTWWALDAVKQQARAALTKAGYTF